MTENNTDKTRMAAKAVADAFLERARERGKSLSGAAREAGIPVQTARNILFHGAATPGAVSRMSAEVFGSPRKVR